MSAMIQRVPWELSCSVVQLIIEAQQHQVPLDLASCWPTIALATPLSLKALAKAHFAAETPLLARQYAQALMAQLFLVPWC